MQRNELCVRNQLNPPQESRTSPRTVRGPEPDLPVRQGLHGARRTRTWTPMPESGRHAAPALLGSVLTPGETVDAGL